MPVIYRRLRHFKTIHFIDIQVQSKFTYIVEWDIFKTKSFMFSYHTLYLLDKQNIMKDSLEVGFGRTSKPCERKKISVILAFEFS